jgi:hypothetical protein
MRGALDAGTHAFTVRGADGAICQGVSHRLGDMYATYLFIYRDGEFWKICEPLPGMMFINAVPVADVGSLPESIGRVTRSLAAPDLSGDALRASLAREANDPIGEIPLVVIVPLMLPYLPILPFAAASLNKEGRRLEAEEAQFDGRLVSLGATPQEVNHAFNAVPCRVGGGPQAQWRLYGPPIDDRLHAPSVVVWFESDHATAVFTGSYAARTSARRAFQFFDGRCI